MGPTNFGEITNLSFEMTPKRNFLLNMSPCFQEFSENTTTGTRYQHTYGTILEYFGNKKPHTLIAVSEILKMLAEKTKTSQEIRAEIGKFGENVRKFLIIIFLNNLAGSQKTSGIVVEKNREGNYIMYELRKKSPIYKTRDNDALFRPIKIAKERISEIIDSMNK